MAQRNTAITPKIEGSMSIASNLAPIREAISAACRRANRSESGVALMAVSKMHPAEAILEAHAAGLRLFGENRVQEFQSKHPLVVALPGATFHLIGPLTSTLVRIQPSPPVK